ncbi:VOC family protein (plasmid) [Agrobacterium sp. 13-2099-1-2]|uniref:VOC family protein n=1 Tax=Agrobacterium sp. 13-2099-1-2 TaxID=1841651 RepID=UPI00080FF19F|nr:VOC family protein [Agrobacterium sp. 13-2099-1-2]UZX45305.1 VOC family protein [Agrobacterium sp. 13-2099-1-2]
MADQDSAAATRLSMGRVALTVNDLDRVSDFYQRSVGLHLLRRDGATAELGAGDETLLELRHDASARRRSPRDAGLFHTAFLLPSRPDLARWTRNAMETRSPVVGASDHSVSEAIYLSDPEGNGVEIYADRPASAWKWQGGLVDMPSDPLDVENLLADANDETWNGFPVGSKIGHVHLQVGAIAPAEEFYAAVLGLDITSRYPGGTFYAADGYHHHIATNIWNSRGAPVRSEPATGLAEIRIELGLERLAAAKARSTQSAANDDEGFLIRDPWGTAIVLVPVSSHNNQGEPA